MSDIPMKEAFHHTPGTSCATGYRAVPERSLTLAVFTLTGARGSQCSSRSEEALHLVDRLWHSDYPRLEQILCSSSANKRETTAFHDIIRVRCINLQHALLLWSSQLLASSTSRSLATTHSATKGVHVAVTFTRTSVPDKSI